MNLSPLRILLIEDKPSDVLLIKKMLAAVVDHTLEQVNRFAAGLERLTQGNIDVILMDINLPDSEGIVSVKEICNRFPHLPLLILTGFPDEEMGIRAIQEGAQDYLVKGRINAEALGRILRYSIERKRIKEEFTKCQDLQLLKTAVEKGGGELALFFELLFERITRLKKCLNSESEVLKLLSELEVAGEKAKIVNSQLIDLFKRWIV